MKNRRMPLHFAALFASVAVTEALLGLEGRWAEALPLHLCGVAAIAAISVTLGARGAALDFLWYLGMPGALLALAFPAPAPSARQALLNASYIVTHAMILLVPLWAMRAGDRPRRGRAVPMLLALQGLALIAFGVNRRLGTDFLFLMSPPPGTPLEAPFALGRGAYLLSLEALMAAVCFAMQGLLGLALRLQRGEDKSALRSAKRRKTAGGGRRLRPAGE